MSPMPKHVMISRVDNIGDVVLTLAMATRLKQHSPSTRITFLARDYVRDVVALCPAVDAFFSADAWLALPYRQAVAELRGLEVDAFIHAFPKSRVAWRVRGAGIPIRIGTARRWYHRLTCNYRPNFSRAKSNEHEAVLNLRLLAPLGITQQPTHDALNDLLRLNAPPAARYPQLSSHKFNLIIHPLTNGHTREWPLANFAELISRLPPEHFQILITGSSKEHPLLQSLIGAHPHVTDLSGSLSLRELCALIAQADGLVANGTGPMHIAAAIGIQTLGLFPLEATISPTRWRPLGARAEYLTAATSWCTPKPCSNDDCRCIRAVSVEAVCQRLLQWAAYHG